MRVFFAAILAMLSLPAIATAADPTGRWSFDVEAFQEGLDAAMEQQLATLPEAVREQMAPMLRQTAREQMGSGPRTVEFEADGTVALQHAEGQRQSGTWTMEDGRIRLVPDGHPQHALVGRIKDDVMRLEPVSGGGVGDIILRRLPD